MNEKCVKFIRKSVKNNLSSVFDVDYGEERESLIRLFENVIRHHKSQSVLLIGSRGVGKTQLLNSITKIYKHDIHLLKLNGFLHTTDALALKSIAVQLNLHEILEKKLTKNITENLKILLNESVKFLDNKVLIIIADEIDLFCTHYNQSLLYNLFEIAQLSQLPVLVIGVTVRLDILELFEKRVKSRFSQRRILMLPCNDFEQYFAKVAKVLIIEDNLFENDVDFCNFLNNWNKKVRKLLKNANLKCIFQRLFNISNYPRNFKNFMICIINRINEENFYLSMTDFEEESKTLFKNNLIDLIKDLSLLELCLIVLIKHYDEIFNKPFNFETIFKNYLKTIPTLTIKQISQEKSVVANSFEKIRNLELIKTAKHRENVQKEFVSYESILTNDEIIEALQLINDLPTGFMQWAINKSIF